MNKRTLLIISSSLIWIFIIGLILFLFLGRSKQAKTIDDVLKEKKTHDNSSKNITLDDYYLFPPSPIFNPSKDSSLNNFYELSTQNKDEKIKQLIKTQSLFNNHEELIQSIFNQIFTDKIKN